MSAFVARLFYVSVPALVFGALAWQLHPVAGVVTAIAVADIGKHATASRSERDKP